MSRPLGFWSLDDRLSEVSAGGDPLAVLNRTVDFQIFRPILARAAGGRAGAQGGRPSTDVVLKFRMPVLRSCHGLSLVGEAEQHSIRWIERPLTERLVRDRLNWMRSCARGLAVPVPDANTLRDFRKAPIRDDALDELFQRRDHAIDVAGFLPRGGQIVDATLVAAPRPRNNRGGQAAIEDGRSAAGIWPDQPAKARQKGTHARWTTKHSKARPVEGKALLDIAIPGFGDKSHVGIDRAHGLIRKGLTADASAQTGRGCVRACCNPARPAARSGPTAQAGPPGTKPGC